MKTPKAWFVLRTIDIPPPEISENAGPESMKGPLCLGHILDDLYRVNVINTASSSNGGPKPIPQDLMPIRVASSTNFTWERKKGRSFGPHTSIGVPVPSAPGLTAGWNASISLSKTESEKWKFDRLDTYSFEPTTEYIKQNLEHDDVKARMRSMRRLWLRWELYMVTGIKVARGASMCTFQSSSKQIDGDLGVNAVGLVDVRGGSSLSTENETSLTQENMSDFIWAVRLEMIQKRMFEDRWSHKRYYSGDNIFCSIMSSTSSNSGAESESESDVGMQPENPDEDVNSGGDADSMATEISCVSWAYMDNTDMDSVQGEYHDLEEEEVEEGEEEDDDDEIGEGYRSGED